MGTPQYPKDLTSEWNKLKKDVKGAFTSANLRVGMAKIGAAVIEVTGELMLNAGAKLTTKWENGLYSSYIGAFNDLKGFWFYRPNGELAMAAFGDEDGNGFLAIYDKEENIIVSDDGASGKGLARPWIPYQVTRTIDITVPRDFITTGTYTPVHTIHGRAQHPRIHIDGYFRADGADTGSWRLRDPDTGAVLATSPTRASGFDELEADIVDYEFDKIFKYDIEVRRASGAGLGVGFTPTYVMGRQS